MSAPGGLPAGLDRAARGLALLALAIYLTVSPALLTVLGIPYDAPYGSFVFKLHPGSYLLALAAALSLAAQGNPLRALPRRLRAQPLLAAYLAAMLLVFGYSLLRHGASGSAFFIDTLMMPAAIALILGNAAPPWRLRVYRTILALVLLNAGLGLAEAALQRHWVPYTVAGGVPVIEDRFRATALLGHPLENALVTSIVLLACLQRPWTPWRRAGLCALLGLALLAFGGRTSFVLTVAALAAWGAFAGWRGLRAGRYGYLHALGAAIAAIFAAPPAALAVWGSGLGQRIFQGLYLDESATVRLRIFAVLDHLDASELAFGIAPAQIQALAARVGLDAQLEAIENFWLFMLLQLGAFGFAVFAAGLLCGLWMLWRQGGAGVRWAVLVFLVTASSTNSLASKTSALTLLFALCCALGAGQAQRAARRAPAPARPAATGPAGAGPAHRPAPVPPPPSCPSLGVSA